MSTLKAQMNEHQHASRILGGLARETPAQCFAAARLDALLDQLASVLVERRRDPTDVWFWAMPDFSPSLNEDRVRRGFPVGGVLNWGDGTDIFTPVGTGINGCGMLVASFASEITPGVLLQRLHSARSDRGLQIDGTKIQWDLGRKNHFLNLYRSEAGESLAILHCSAPELKALEHCLPVTRVDTPSGPLEIYDGTAAQSYEGLVERRRSFAIAKREFLARMILGEDIAIIYNDSHMTLAGRNCAALGCYFSPAPLSRVPLLVAPGEAAYLVSSANATLLPFGWRYLLPHGTGNAASADVSEINFDQTTGTLMVQGKNVLQGYSDLSAALSEFPRMPDWLALLRSGDVPNTTVELLRPVLETKIGALP